MWIKLRFVFQMSLVFPERKTILTGNPRGQEVVTVEKSAILSEFGLDPKKTVVLFGGSRGALKINQAFEQAFPLFEERVSSFIRFRRKILSGTSRKSKAF